MTWLVGEGLQSKPELLTAAVQTFGRLVLLPKTVRSRRGEQRRLSADSLLTEGHVLVCVIENRGMSHSLMLQLIRGGGGSHTGTSKCSVVDITSYNI